MNNKLIRPITYLGTGILTFIFMALDFFKATVKYGKNSETEGQNAFDFMDWDVEGADAAFLKSLSTIALVGLIIVSVVLIVIAIVKLLPAFGVKIEALEKVETIADKFLPLVLKLLVVFSVVALVFAAVFGALNTEEIFGIKMTLTPAIGAYLLVILSLVPSAVEKFLAKKEVAAPSNEEEA